MCLDLRPQADRYNRLKDLNYAKVDIRWNWKPNFAIRAARREPILQLLFRLR